MVEKDKMAEMGRQLRCPSGETAIEVADNMFLSNENMILRTIDQLSVKDGQRILELGFGSGKHLSYLFGKARDLQYWGVDISGEMITLARENNPVLVREGKGIFQLVDGKGKLPYAEDHSDIFFSVNTLYFWPDISFQLREIHRVLKVDGQVAIGYIEKSFGEKLPFTQTGFSFYETKAVEQYLKDAGFHSIRTMAYNEEAIAKDGNKIKRPYFISHGKK